MLKRSVMLVYFHIPLYKSKKDRGSILIITANGRRGIINPAFSAGISKLKRSRYALRITDFGPRLKSLKIGCFGWIHFRTWGIAWSLKVKRRQIAENGLGLKSVKKIPMSYTTRHQTLNSRGISSGFFGLQNLGL